MDDTELTHALLGVPLFEDLTIDQVGRIREACTYREVDAGEVLCQPETVDDRLHILVEGELRLESADGTRLADVHAPAVQGEMGVFTSRPRSSRVVCPQAASVLELDRGVLEDLVAEDPDLGYDLLAKLLGLLYDRIHDSNRDTEQLRREVGALRARLRAVAPDDPLVRSTGE